MFSKWLILSVLSTSPQLDTVNLHWYSLSTYSWDIIIERTDTIHYRVLCSDTPGGPYVHSYIGGSADIYDTGHSLRNLNIENCVEEGDTAYLVLEATFDNYDDVVTSAEVIVQLNINSPEPPTGLNVTRPNG